MDIRTLAIVLGLTHLIQLIVFSLQAWVNRTYRGIGWWLLWSASAAGGFVFVLLRTIPAIERISIVAQNALIVLGTVFLYIGIVRFLDKKEQRWIVASIYAAFLTSLAYFAYVDDDIAVRTVILCVTLATMSFLSAQALLANKTRAIRATAYFCTAVFLAHGAVFLHRAAMVLAGTDVSDVFRPTLFNVIPFLDGILASLLWTCGLVIMVSQRSNAEMKEAKDRFELMFNTSPDAVLITRAQDGLCREVNESFLALTGFTRAEVAGRSSLDLQVYGEPADRQRVVDELSARGFCENIELPFRLKDGSRITGSMSARLFSLDGIPHVISVTRDISERQRAEEKLRESERRLSEAQTMAQLGYWSWDVKTGAVEWTDEVFRIFHLDQKEFVPHIDSILALSPWPEDHERDRELIRRAMETHELGSYDQRFLRPDGSVGHYRSTFQGKYDEGGNLTSIVGTVQDTTERMQADEQARHLLAEVEASRGVLLSVVEDQKRAELEVRRLNVELEQRVRDRTADLQAANRELEAFSYSVSHDLRAPLRAINGYAQMLTEDYGAGLDVKGQRVLGVVRTEALRMGQLIDDLLQFSRLGRHPLRKTPTDMTALVREVQAELLGRAPDRAVDFRVDSLPAVSADPALLRQVWLNLLDNALKYTRHRIRAEIRVAGSIEAREAVYSVKDNGAGFDMKYADKLFGVFQRLHRAEEFEGTGVGLALVQRVVHRHGGRVWAEAEPDRGATFYFTLPVAAGPAAPEEPSVAAGGSGALDDGADHE